MEMKGQRGFSSSPKNCMDYETKAKAVAQAGPLQPGAGHETDTTLPVPVIMQAAGVATAKSVDELYGRRWLRAHQPARCTGERHGLLYSLRLRTGLLQT